MMHLSAVPLRAHDLLALMPLERRERRLPDPLYVAGDLECLAAPTVAVVGTRAPSSTGARLAREIARDLARAGIVIISGLARGIDAAAHEGALDVEAPTVGVLAGGHKQLYPREHGELATRMIAHAGAVISAYDADEIPFPARFLERNGVIVALADAVVIIEAPQRSGALNTAAWAADGNVPVLVMPGDVDRPKIAGNLALLRDGATLIRHADDVLEALGCTRVPRTRARSSQHIALPFDRVAEAADIATPLALTLTALRGGPLCCDDLARATGLPIAQLMSTLVMLECEGRLVAGDDGRYAIHGHDQS